MLNIQTGVTTFYVKGFEALKVQRSEEMQQELFSISIMQKAL